jgi:hypothetical protein
MLRPSLDQLILQLGGFLPLGLELAPVLGGKVVLGSCNPEKLDLVKKLISKKQAGQHSLPLSATTWAARSLAGDSGSDAAQKKVAW